LKEEPVVNVECSLGGIGQTGGWTSGLKGTDDISEAEREHRLDESRKAL
jgi:hypothetical protein